MFTRIASIAKYNGMHPCEFNSHAFKLAVKLSDCKIWPDILNCTSPLIALENFIK